MPGETRKRKEQEIKRNRVSHLISQVPFVQETWVDYDETRTNGLSQQMKRSIVVGVKPNQSKFLSMLEVAAIREIVRGSIAGVENEDVVITDINAGISFRGNEFMDEHELKGSLATQIHLNEIRQVVTQALASYVDFQVEVIAQRARSISKIADANLPATMNVGGANQAFSVSHVKSDDILSIKDAREIPVTIRVTVSTSTIEKWLPTSASGYKKPTRENRENALGKAKAQMLPIVKNAVQAKSKHKDNQFQIVSDSTMFSQVSPGASIIRDSDWKTLTNWISVNWIPLMLITAAVICILLLLRRNPAIKNQWKTTNSVAKQTQKRPATAPPNRPIVHPAVPQNNELRQDKQLRQEISEFIRNHPDQATEILQDWMKDAA